MNTFFKIYAMPAVNFYLTRKENLEIKKFFHKWQQKKNTSSHLQIYTVTHQKHNHHKNINCPKSV